MRNIIIKKNINNNGETTFLVRAISLKQNNGKLKKIPHPLGTDIIEFATIEETINAINLSGFDYILPDGISTIKQEITTKLPKHNDEWEDLIYKSLLLETKNPNTTIQAAAILSLGEIKGEDLLPIYIDKMGEDNENIRNNAIDSIVKLGAISSKALIKTLSDENWIKRNSAITCIEKIVMTTQTNPEIFFESLLDRFSDKNAIVKTSAITILGKLYKIYKEKQKK